jgi:predicted metal-binding protein
MRQWRLENQVRLIEAERRILLAGFEKTFLLSFDNCNLCEVCAPTPSECRQPYKRRPTMEAFAIDVYSSVRKFGYTLSVKRDRREKSDRFALLLVE